MSEHRRQLTVAQEVAREGTDEPMPERLERIRELAGESAVVDFGDRRVELGTDPLLAALDGDDTADFRTAAAHLDTLLAELDAADAAEPIDPAALDGALEEAYRGVEATRTWQEYLGLLAGEFLTRFVAVLTGAGGWLRVLGLLAAAAGLVTAVVWFARRMTVVGDERLDRDGAAAERAVDWEQRAEEALARGDLEEAVRARFRLLVTALDARGIVEDAPSLTPAECRAAVAGRNATLAAPVARATDAVEDVVYGERPAEREHLAAVQDAAAKAAP